jgi:hypothetical protein
VKCLQADHQVIKKIRTYEGETDGHTD